MVIGLFYILSEWFMMIFFVCFQFFTEKKKKFFGKDLSNF